MDLPAFVLSISQSARTICGLNISNINIAEVL